MDFYPILIKLHITIASLALLFGIANLLLRKVKRIHRHLGMIWLFCILFTIFSSFAIREMNSNSYSILHMLSLWTLLVVCTGLLMLKRKNYHLHGKLMLSVTGGTLLAGIISVATSRYYMESTINFVKNML